MLKIHKPNHKLLTISITSICGIGALLGLSALTYTPELSHAETVFYPEKETRDMSQITYMQDITPEICTNTPEADAEGHNQFQLKDSRDQKSYWVAKLKDGNCWMTQNLDLDLWDNKSNVGTRLSNMDSDLPDSEEWISNTGPSARWNYLSTNSNMARYFNPGNSYCNVGTYTCGVVSQNNKHDSQGNYYTWAATTAGANYEDYEKNDIVNNSICPKQWKLPLSGDIFDSTNGSFYNLLNMYGLTSTPNDENNEYNIQNAPLYFVIGGSISSSDASSWERSAGVYRSSVITTPSIDSGVGYTLTFNNRYVNPSNTSPMGSGFSVRCMSPGGVINDKYNVSVNVTSTLSLDVAPEVEVETSAANPSTANLDVKVSSNQPYSVNINAKSHAELTSSTTEVKIPSANGALNNNTNEWGIKKPEGTQYTVVTTTPELFYQSSVAEIKTIPFIIGISTSPDIPNGEYSTDITITATQN